MLRETRLLAREIPRTQPSKVGFVSNVVASLCILSFTLFAGSSRIGEAPAVVPLPVETGGASVYSDGLNGRPTASGERYDRNALTAAHRTLPLGSRIKVTNLGNNESVIVRVNDRRPHNGGRILDLSRRAAETLGVRTGVLRVRIEVLSLPPIDRPTAQRERKR